MARRAWLLVAVSVVVSLAVVSGLWLNFSADPTGATHTTGTVVTVTATAADGYGLSSWGDDCAGTPTTSMTCSLTMDADKTAKATFTELTCESGPAVPNPSVNSRLVDDCARLLALRDTLSETGTLNWTPGTAMTSWTGVTVGGSPRRVTKLHLANNGLTGQVSGLIGELTGLTELRLNGNKLTGRLPSKLGQLTRLTHAYIAGNAFAGCVPPLLRTVANNDVVHVGLADCAEPIDVSCEYGPLTAGAYQFRWDDQSVPLIFDIPPGLTLRVDAVVIPEVGEDGSYAPPGLILQHYQGDSWICLDLEDGSECNRWTPSSAGVRESNSARVRGSSEADVDSLFDRLAESVWVERAGTPATSATCSLTMDADRTASATFAKNSAPTTLRYSTYDTTGQAATAGSYAFLTANGAGSQREGGDGGARQSEGSTTPVAITTYEGLRTEADTLRIHVTDGSGVSRASFYGTVGVGDTFEWREASDCWVRYLVTAVKPGTSPREFVIWPYSYTYTGCSGTVASGRSAPGDTAQGGERSSATATAMRDFTWKPAYLRTGDFKVPTWHGPWVIVPTSWTGPVPVARSLAPPVAPPAITWPPDPLPDPDLGPGWRGGVHMGYGELEGWYSHADGGSLDVYIWQLQKWPLGVYRMGLPFSEAARINEFVIIDGRPAHVSYSRVKHDGSEAQAIIFDPATGLVYNVRGGPLARQNDPDATIEIAKKFILPVTPTDTAPPTATVTPTTYALALSAATGGSLSAGPAGESHAAGTVVTVTATAADGYGLSSWGDDCAGTPATSATCSLTLDADRTASATFAKNSAPTTLRYSTYDTTGAVTAAGSYAFLANGGGAQAGAERASAGATATVLTTYEGWREEADTLRINLTDGAGVSRASFYGTVTAGDMFEWRIANDCWTRYQVMRAPGAVALATDTTSNHREFGVKPVSYAFTGCGGMVAASTAGVADFGPLPVLGGLSLTVPVVHGIFQLVPAGWTGSTKPVGPRMPARPTIPSAEATSLAEARKLPHWREPELSEGWKFSYAVSGDEAEAGYFTAYYNGLDLTVSAAGINAKYSPKQASETYYNGSRTSVRETLQIAGRPARVHRSLTAKQFPTTVHVWDEATGVLYTLHWSGHAAKLIALAESMFE